MSGNDKPEWHRTDPSVSPITHKNISDRDSGCLLLLLLSLCVCVFGDRDSRGDCYVFGLNADDGNDNDVHSLYTKANLFIMYSATVSTNFTFI